jgi:hypothetical protein
VEACGRFDSYSLKFSAPLVSLCQGHAAAAIVAGIQAACK